MKNIAIDVKNLSKQYFIGANQADTLRDQIANGFKRLVTRNSNITTPRSVWALKDIEFALETGEVLGVIGNNGAGKSTLLKILSRITHPTTGRIEINGRVSSLLEVGTGFHPELTGRENVYMNASILGMKRSEIRRNFDDIVEFSGVGNYIDTPVKHYSTGMGVRLAFAVAAYLEPEILIVDEVLAVGDMDFQKKSLGKMSDIASNGRTVLFVSHNLGAVSSLCSRAVLLEKGKIKFEGSVSDTISHYIDSHQIHGEGQVIWEIANAPGDKVKLHTALIKCAGNVTANVPIDEEMIIEFEYWNLKDGAMLIPSVHLRDKNGAFVLVSGNMHSANLSRDPWFDQPHPIGLYRTCVVLPGNLLNDGRYYIDIGVGNGRNFEVNMERVLAFTVHETGAMTQELTSSWVGVVRPKLAWTTERID